MARLSNIPSGSGSQNASASIVDSEDKVVAVTIENIGAVDVFVSEDRTRLDATLAGTNLPTAGFLFPAYAAPNANILHMPRFKGKLYARSQAAGAILEVLVSDIC